MAEKLLDLSAKERTACVRFRSHIGERSATHVFRPLTLQDWLDYLKALGSEIVIEGDDILPQADVAGAAAALWQAAILRVSGYKPETLSEAEGWKGRIPLSHKLAAVEGLQEVYLAEGSSDPFDLTASGRTVILDAAWNGERFPRLVHRFQDPSAAQELAFRRLDTRSYRIGGARGGSARIRKPPVLLELCKLYDELIVEIEGYRSGAETPSGVEGRRQLVSVMDPLHKQAAVLGLFAPPITARIEEEAAAA